MANAQSDKTDDLYAFVQQRMTAFIREMEDAGWSAGDVALAVKEVIETQWLEKAQKLRRADEAVSVNFVSDGNEG